MLKPVWLMCIAVWMLPVWSWADGSASDASGLGHEQPMNFFSSEARLRSELFESIALRHGFSLIEGRFGGDFNNDQLAFKEQGSRVILLLGLKRTSSTGDLQMDQMSMGPFLQFSSKWMLAVIQSLKLSENQYQKAIVLEKARAAKTLDFVLLLHDRVANDVKFLGVKAPD